MGSSARPSILCLPNEILISIFGAVCGGSPAPLDQSRSWQPLDQYGTRDIQSIRLTCRRFCSTSSKFLINSVSVETTQQSLARLDEISSHPTIGPGVVAIEIHLAVYNRYLAVGRDLFAIYHTKRLREHMTPFNDLQREQNDFSEQVALTRNQKITSTTRAWDALACKPVHHHQTEEDFRYHRILERGHEEYEDHYWKQQITLDSGIFVAQFTSALVKMPAVRHLRIHDVDDEMPARSQQDRDKSFDAQLFNDEELCKALSKRQHTSYKIDDHDELRLDALGLTPLILAAFDAPDVRPLVSLEIELSTIRNFLEFSFDDDVCHRIGSAMRGLKVFRFIHRGPVLIRSDKELEILRDFLTPIINAEPMESLDVQLNMWNDEESVLDPAALPLVGIIKARTTWPQLSSVNLDTLHIGHSDLTHLLNCVDSTQGFVGLHKIHLTDGSWASILDVLKERHRWSNLTSPSGAECETMSVDEYESIFGSYSRVDNRTHEEEASSGPRAAEIYIRGWGTGNPLLVPPDIESDLQDY